MLTLISTLQSDRLNEQRAELRPVNPQATLPGVGVIPTTRPKPEDDFIEVLARVQVRCKYFPERLIDSKKRISQQILTTIIKTMRAETSNLLVRYYLVRQCYIIE